MNRQEQLFQAIGGADPYLIARSEKRRRRHWARYCLAAAACFALLLTAKHFWPKPMPPATMNAEGFAPGETPWGMDGGNLWLLSYVPLSQEKALDFLIYVNKEQFEIHEENGIYSIRSKDPLPDSFPECGLDILHIPRISTEEAREEAEKVLVDRYAEIIPGDGTPISSLRASSGTDWDSEQAELWFENDGQGGTFVLIAHYFLEAEEGMGRLFQDMVSSFRMVSRDEFLPEWMRSLYETADRLFPALLSNDLSGVSDLLAKDAEPDAYGEDVWEYLSVASVDYVPDDDHDPTSATVSVRHRLNLEEGESYNYLTMEMIRQDGKWLLRWSGIEK